MAVGKDVQDKIDAANKLAEELFAAQEESVVVEPPENTTPEMVVTPGNEPIETPIVEVQEQLEPEPIDLKEEETFKHKYDVLKGKYTSEIKRANERIDSLESLLAQLAAQPKETITPTVTKETAPTIEEVFTDDMDIASLKEDYPPVYRAMVKMLEKQKSVPDVTEKVTNLEKKIEEDSLMRFYNTLSNSVTDWESINTDPLFMDWLKEPIPYTKTTLHAALVHAFNQKDVDTVASIFNDYKVKTSTPSPVTPTVKPSSNVSQFVAPPRVSRGGTGGSTPTKTYYKKEEVETFYRNLAQRKLPLTKEQILLKEQEYFSAAKEGRII